MTSLTRPIPISPSEPIPSPHKRSGIGSQGRFGQHQVSSTSSSDLAGRVASAARVLVPPEVQKMPEELGEDEPEATVVHIRTDAEGRIIEERPVTAPPLARGTAAMSEGDQGVPAEDQSTEGKPAEDTFLTRGAAAAKRLAEKFKGVKDTVETAPPGVVTPTHAALGTAAAGIGAGVAVTFASTAAATCHNLHSVVTLGSKFGAGTSLLGGGVSMVAGVVRAQDGARAAVAATSTEEQVVSTTKAGTGIGDALDGALSVASAATRLAGVAGVTTALTGASGAVGVVVGGALTALAVRDAYKAGQAMEQLKGVFALLPKDPTTCWLEEGPAFTAALGEWLIAHFTLSEAEIQQLPEEKQKKRLEEKLNAMKDLFGEAAVQQALEYLSKTEKTPAPEVDQLIQDGALLLATLLTSAYEARVKSMIQVAAGVATVAAGALAVPTHGIAPAVVGGLVLTYTLVDRFFKLNKLIAAKLSSDEPWSTKRRGELLASLTHLHDNMIRYSPVQILSGGDGEIVMTDIEDALTDLEELLLDE